MGFDHIEHVRTVHATGLILCFALLATASLTREPEVKTAVEDLRSIYRVVRVWREESVVHGVKAIIEPRTGEDLDWYFIDPTQKTPIPVRLGFTWTALPQPELGALLVMPEVIEHSAVLQDFNWDFGLAKPSTLAEFSKIWNSLDHLTIFRGYLAPDSFGIMEDLDEVVRHISVRSGESDQTFSCGLGDDPVEDRAVRLDLVPSDALENDDHSGLFWEEARGLAARSSSSYVFLGHCNTFTLAVGAKIEEVKVDGQSAFNRTYGKDWLPGPFKRSFPELDRVTKNYQALSFDQLFTVLESELSRSADSVEVFGAKIPSSEVFRWGVPAILVVQIYLLLHLGALNSIPSIGKRVQGQEVAWIGIYEGGLAFFATLFSAFLFPLATVIFIVVGHIQESGSSGGLPIGIAALLVSVLAALQSIRSWWQLRRFVGSKVPEELKESEDKATILPNPGAAPDG